MLLTLINCLGVRFGSSVQSVFMILKIAAILALIATGFLVNPATAAHVPHWAAERSDSMLSFAAATVPVLFAYGGWQTASFMTGEMRDPKRDLSRALLLGVAGVIAVYLGVNVVCLRVLGPRGLAATVTPAYTVMQNAVGRTGRSSWRSRSRFQPSGF